MDLGRTLLGAVVGAAVGVGLHLALGAVMKSEAVWFAIIIGALVGLGVRQAHKSLVGHVSYARGAVTAAIALAAIFASVYFVRIVIAKTVIKRELVDRPLGGEPEAPPIGATTAGQTATEEPAGEASPDEELTSTPTPQPKATVREKTAEARFEDFNVWEFLSIAVGVFLAYELARGTGLKAPAASDPEAV